MGAWIEITDSLLPLKQIVVAPPVGAWIEIVWDDDTLSYEMSLPPWERGLKLKTITLCWMSALVAPLVGAWVEMEARKTDGMRNFVAPLVGAWVEILNITEPQKVYMVAPLVGAWVEITILS